MTAAAPTRSSRPLALLVAAGALGLLPGCTNPDGTLNGGATALALGAAGLAAGAVILADQPQRSNTRWHSAPPVFVQPRPWGPSWGVQQPWGWNGHQAWHGNGWNGGGWNNGWGGGAWHRPSPGWEGMWHGGGWHGGGFSHRRW